MKKRLIKLAAAITITAPILSHASWVDLDNRRNFNFGDFNPGNFDAGELIPIDYSGAGIDLDNNESAPGDYRARGRALFNNLILPLRYSGRPAGWETPDLSAYLNNWDHFRPNGHQWRKFAKAKKQFLRKLHSGFHYDYEPVTATAVPVPAAAWLFGSSLALVGLTKARRTKS